VRTACAELLASPAASQRSTPPSRSVGLTRRGCTWCTCPPRRPTPTLDATCTSLGGWQPDFQATCDPSFAGAPPPRL